MLGAEGVVGLSRITPTGFLPEDDQGALFVVVQLPGGASVARTTDVIRRTEDVLREEEAVQDFTSVIGLNFIDNYSQPNAAFVVVTLKPFEERKDRSLGAPELIARLSAKFRQIQGGTVVPSASARPRGARSGSRSIRTAESISSRPIEIRYAACAVIGRRNRRLLRAELRRPARPAGVCVRAPRSNGYTYPPRARMWRMLESHDALQLRR